MAVLGATNFAVVIPYRGIRRADNRKVVRGTLTLTAGADTYPTGGIALPAISAFGFIRNMDNLLLTEQGAPANSYKYEYDKANQKLQLFVSHDTAGVTTLPMDEETDAEAIVAPTTRTYEFIATGW